MASSINDKNSGLVSKRWAHALIELAQEDNGASMQEILSDLKDVVETINSSDELSEVINNPSISTEEKQIVLCKLFQNTLKPVVYNFIFALNLRKRVNIIAEITEEFEKELEKINNITHVAVTSAIGLDDGKKNEIKEKISSKLNKEVIVDWSEDSDIIAGLVFNIDETIVDNSVRHKLDDLGRKIGIKGK